MVIVKCRNYRSCVMHNTVPANKRTLGLILLFLFLAAGIRISSAEHLKQIVVDVSIPSGYKEIIAGDSFLARVDVNLISQENGHELSDLLFNYTIKNQEGITLFTASETKGAAGQISIVKKLLIPGNAASGLYTVEVEVRHGDMERNSFASVKVQENDRQARALQEQFPREMIISGFLFIFLVFLALAWYLRQKFLTIKTYHEKVEKHLKLHSFTSKRHPMSIAQRRRIKK